MKATTNNLTLSAALWPAHADNRLLRLGILALAGSAILALSAKIQIPFWPVPVTMQTFVVLVIGMAYGWRLGGATVLFYLAQGAMGIPVFAKGGGLAYFAGPTGGYLLGFLTAAMLMGWLAEQGWSKSPLKTVAAMTLGTATIFVFGVGWLAYLLGFEKAIAAGLAPFMLGEICKIAIATVFLPTCWRALKKFGHSPD